MYGCGLRTAGSQFAGERKMEKLCSNKNSTSRSKRKRESKSTSNVDINSIFSLLLDAVSGPRNPSSFSSIRNSLAGLRRSLLSESLQCLPSPILSLLPRLIHSECAKIASLSLEIVGAASLLSLDMNEMIASDDEVVKALIAALACSKKRTALAACNAVLDLSTTSFGRQRLFEFSAVERLISAFLQVSGSSKMSISVGPVNDGNFALLKAGFKGDELSVLILNAAILFINTSHFKHLETVPPYCSEIFLVYLKNLWTEVRKKMLFVNNVECSEQEILDISNVKINDLAESIFRLSVGTNQLSILLPVKEVKSLFGLSETNSEEFMLNHWEASPCLMQHSLRTLNEEADIFRPLVGSIDSTETICSSLPSLLGRLVSCHPLASDELDIYNFLKEVRNELGYPLIYQQDIRVLRTDGCLKKEIHFFRESFESCCISTPHFLKLNDALKCKKAFKEGYTIALRGMEFRCKRVAAIANNLASLFGQPSVGVNMYLTPPGSQGLACHYDDHCVFVCQLAGSKQWTVFTPPKMWLPRLYDTHELLHCSEVEGSMAVGRQFLLQEGDVLYIPRGFLHEARTENDGPGGSSIHLTFGIEVEPPFEWEGFLHIALYCWHDNPKHCNTSFETISLELLHIAIELISMSDHNIRKACLVGAISLPSDSIDRHELNQRTTFRKWIDKIHRESKFLEVLASIEIAVKKDEDPFHRMRWLRLLNADGKETAKEDKWTMPSVSITDLFSTCDNHKEKVETTFMEVKSRFCSEVQFENVVGWYRKLLERYRTVRSQYMTGMISLH